MPSYEEMLEYVLDMGKECECCRCSEFCKGIVLGPNGPMFPQCSTRDFGELLLPKYVETVYKEAHADV